MEDVGHFEDSSRGHSRVLLGGVYPEGEQSTDIVVTQNNHGSPTPLPNLVSRRRLAQAGYDGLGSLSQPGDIVCGDGICGGEASSILLMGLKLIKVVVIARSQCCRRRERLHLQQGLLSQRPVRRWQVPGLAG